MSHAFSYLLVILGSWSLWPSSELASLESEQARLEGELAKCHERQPFEPTPAVGFHSRWVKRADTALSVTVDLGAVYPLEEIFVVPALPASGRVYGFPTRYRVQVSAEESFQHSTMILDRTGEDHPVPTGPVRMTARGAKGRWIRFTATKLSRQPNWEQGYMFCLGEVLAFSGHRNVALRCRVDSTDSNLVYFPTWAPENLVDGLTGLGLPVEPDSKPGEKISSGWHSQDSRVPDTEKWVQVDLGREVPLEEIRVVPANPVTFTNRPGFGFPVRFKIEASTSADFQSSAVMLVDQRDTDFPNPGDNVVAWPVANIVARYVRFTATRLFLRWDDYVFSLAELELYSNGKNVAREGKVTSQDTTPYFMFQPEYLIDGWSSSKKLQEPRTWLNALAYRVELEAALESVRQQLALAQVKARERWLTLTWLGGAALLAGGVTLFYRARRQREKAFRELRSQIARDLHDEIGSSLGSIALLSELGTQGATADSLDEIHALAVEASDSMRAILWMIRDGRPPMLNELGDTLRSLGEKALRGRSFHFETEGEIPQVEMPLTFYRNVFLFFKEAVHNIAKHSGAAQVSVKLRWTPRALHLEIADDGCGFDADGPFAGSGIANMRHRAGNLQAALVIASSPGQGTRISMEAPLK